MDTRGRTYEEQVAYVTNPENFTLPCPHCKKMNLPDSQYCNFCGYAIGQRTIDAIRKNKMNLIMLAFESDEQLLNECFILALKRMVGIEAPQSSSIQSKTQLEEINKRGRA
jgi:hypothetical protein